MSTQKDQSVPIVTAVPVTQPNVQVYVQATPAADNLSPYNSSGETSDIGICRKCRRQFRRPPGVNDGQAQYYRCAECDDQRIFDLAINSCSIQ